MRIYIEFCIGGDSCCRADVYFDYNSNHNVVGYGISVTKWYFISVTVGCIFLALSELILPQGKIKKCAAYALSVCFALIVISPFTKNDDSFFTMITSENTSIVPDDTVEDTLERLTEKSYENTYIIILEDYDLIAERVEVEICRSEIQKIRIYLSNLVIKDSDERININVITKYISEILNADIDKIEVYG